MSAEGRDGRVVGDAVDPATKWPSGIVAIDVFIDFNKGVLDDVLILVISAEIIDVAQEGRLVTMDNGGKCGHMACLETDGKTRIGWVGESCHSLIVCLTVSPVTTPPLGTEVILGSKLTQCWLT